MAIKSIHADEEFFATVCDAYMTHPKLSFTDCLLAETAHASHALPLWTFDEKLATQHPAAQLVPPTPMG